MPVFESKVCVSGKTKRHSLKHHTLDMSIVTVTAVIASGRVLSGWDSCTLFS